MAGLAACGTLTLMRASGCNPLASGGPQPWWPRAVVEHEELGHRSGPVLAPE